MTINLHEFTKLILELHKKKNFKEALFKIDEFEKNNFRNPIILNLKGLTLFLLNIFGSAINSFNEALKNIDENNPKNNDLIISILNNKGMTNLNSANYSEAIHDFYKIIKINPNFYQAYNHLGVAYENLGKREQSVKYFIKSNNLNENYIPARNNLIKSLTFCKDLSFETNKIVTTELNLKKNKFYYNPKKKIDQKNIFSTLEKANRLIQEYLGEINSKDIQTFRRGNRYLNCGRHKKIFNERKIIPEFCFGCFKILIEPKSLIDLIKLYILFDNYEFKNGNPRKCMIEKRKNVKGIYKGYIYCNSLNEAQEILKDIINYINLNMDLKTDYEIKRGCTEYLDFYPEYGNLKNLMNYKEEWKNDEEEMEKQFPYLKDNSFDLSTVEGVSLRDILAIRNWIYFAYLKDDKSYKLVSETLHKNIFIKNILDIN